MGKNLIQQRKGKGSIFKAPHHKFKGQARHKNGYNSVDGIVKDIIDCPGHSAPLLDVVYSDGENVLTIAPEGIAVGDQITNSGSPDMGNTLMLKDIPEGATIFNIEKVPNDGGRFVRASGTFARIVSKTPAGIMIRLPSNTERIFLPECKATIGIVAGGGRSEKPFLKAGTRWYAMKARGHVWPKVAGTSMNAVDHPYGGKSSHTKGRPTVARRHAPPGAKVGKIRPSRTGRTKR